MLVVGCWLLAVGCWLLAVGCWLLVVGLLVHDVWRLSVRGSLCAFSFSCFLIVYGLLVVSFMFVLVLFV